MQKARKARMKNVAFRLPSLHFPLKTNKQKKSHHDKSLYDKKSYKKMKKRVDILFFCKTIACHTRAQNCSEHLWSNGPQSKRRLAL